METDCCCLMHALQTLAQTGERAFQRKEDTFVAVLRHLQVRSDVHYRNIIK